MLKNKQISINVSGLQRRLDDIDASIGATLGIAIAAYAKAAGIAKSDVEKLYARYYKTALKKFLRASRKNRRR